MLVHKYNKDTKEYMGSIAANLDPLETKIRGKEVYALPLYATFIAPPKLRVREMALFNGKDWDVVEDNRGLTVYNKVNGHELLIQEFGAIPDGYVKERPIFVSELREEKLQEIKDEFIKESDKLHEVCGVKVCVNQLSDLSMKFNIFGDKFITINIAQEDEDVAITKPELEEVLKYLYVRSMLLSQRKRELIEKLHILDTKSKIQKFKIDFNIDKEVDKLMKLTVEEINERFMKHE